MDGSAFDQPGLQFTSDFPPTIDEAQVSCITGGRDHSVEKKLSHNANERYRRKRMNSLFSALRSLLPNPDQTVPTDSRPIKNLKDEEKKLSVPATVSRALRYIPELQKQVESLIQKRKEILERMSRKENKKFSNKSISDPLPRAPTILATQIHDNELLVQVSTTRQGYLLSQVVRNLEDDGLQLLNASTFGSGEERVFYSIHLQMEDKSTPVNSEAIRQKLILLSGTRGGHNQDRSNWHFY